VVWENISPRILYSVDKWLNLRPGSNAHEYEYKSECTSTRKHEIQGILRWSIHTETSPARVWVVCDSYSYESNLHKSCFRQLIWVLFVYTASSICHT